MLDLPRTFETGGCDGSLAGAAIAAAVGNNVPAAQACYLHSLSSDLEGGNVATSVQVARQQKLVYGSELQPARFLQDQTSLFFTNSTRSAQRNMGGANKFASVDTSSPCVLQPRSSLYLGASQLSPPELLLQPSRVERGASSLARDPDLRSLGGCEMATAFEGETHALDNMCLLNSPAASGSPVSPSLAHTPLHSHLLLAQQRSPPSAAGDSFSDSDRCVSHGDPAFPVPTFSIEPQQRSGLTMFDHQASEGLSDGSPDRSPCGLLALPGFSGGVRGQRCEQRSFLGSLQPHMQVQNGSNSFCITDADDAELPCMPAASQGQHRLQNASILTGVSHGMGSGLLGVDDADDADNQQALLWGSQRLPLDSKNTQGTRLHTSHSLLTQHGIEGNSDAQLLRGIITHHDDQPLVQGRCSSRRLGNTIFGRHLQDLGGSQRMVEDWSDDFEAGEAALGQWEELAGCKMGVADPTHLGQHKGAVGGNRAPQTPSPHTLSQAAPRPQKRVRFMM